MPEPSPFFLTERELFELTGRKLRRLQIEQLKRMLIPFHINALGRPVVTRGAIVGGLGDKGDAATSAWEPRVIKG